MTSPSNDDIHTDITVHEQLQQLQNEMDKLRRSNEVLKISGRGITLNFLFLNYFLL